MTNHNLTDLLPDWHLLPASGGLILKDERYAIVDEDGRSLSIFTSDVDWTSPADDRLLTEHPVTPPLPTEEGTVILASTNELPPCILLTRKDGCWVTCYGSVWSVYQIASWAPVTIGETVICRPVYEVTL